jgi:enoyl-[acyl-carrier protein] reductase II
MHPIVKTSVCGLLGIEKPIIQAGMGFVARAASNAGALGVIGAASLTLAQLRGEIRKVRDMTDKPFGVDILFATYGRPSPVPRIEEFTDDVREQIDMVFEERVPVLASGLGNPAPVVPQAHELGIKVIAVVGNTKNAKRCPVPRMTLDSAIIRRTGSTSVEGMRTFVEALTAEDISRQEIQMMMAENPARPLKL